jgi:hypothetical protein
MTKELTEALNAVLEIIMRENPNAVRATVEFEAPGVCTVEVESKEGILLKRL